MPAKLYRVEIASKRQEGSNGDARAACLMDELFVEWSWGRLGAAKPLTGTDEMNYVLEGEGRWVVDGAEMTVSAGQVLYIPAHAAREEVGGDGHVMRVSTGLPWDRIGLAMDHVRSEYRDWQFNTASK